MVSYSFEYINSQHLLQKNRDRLAIKRWMKHYVSSFTHNGLGASFSGLHWLLVITHMVHQKLKSSSYFSFPMKLLVSEMATHDDSHMKRHNVDENIQIFVLIIKFWFLQQNTVKIWCSWDWCSMQRCDVHCNFKLDVMSLLVEGLF